MLQTHPATVSKISELGDSDQNLIRMVLQRNQVAFRKLYDRHLPVVYGLCLRLTGNAHQAEDATQEVFIRLWHKIGSFRGNSSFSTWLHRLTTNTTISYLRRQKSWLQRIRQDEDFESRAEALPDSAPVDLQILMDWLPRLPERARLVFVLQAIEGYRQEQVAELMGISTGTVKAQFHRASTQLKQWLGEATGDEQ